MNQLIKQLVQHIDGDVLTDALSRMLYANDASPFQELPLAIARPRHTKDCIAIVKFSAQHKIPLIARAAGTSLAGQCVGKGIIVDVRRYMNQIISIDIDNRRAKVEPGVVCNDLNDQLRPFGLMFAPDPSTSNYCTFGGMVGNNAWGIHSQRYGTTRDNTVQIEVVLSDGSMAIFGPLNTAALQNKLQLKNREGAIYRSIVDIINKQQKLIQNSFPAPDNLLRNAGYPLDFLAQGQPWHAQGPLFNLAPFLCGTEGTLALTTAIEIKLVNIPQKRLMLCAHFQSVDVALKAVPQILCHQPAALEIVDHHILKLTETNLIQQPNRFWLKGNPAAVLLIEFHDDYLSLVKTSEQVIDQLYAEIPAYAFSVVESAQIDKVWALRKSGLGLLMGVKGSIKGVTGIEDTAVRTADLSAYVKAVKKILSQHDTDCVVYGPAGRGTLHLRPELNLNLETDRQKYKEILDQVTDLVISLDGSISAKHGDGRLRGYFLERLLGSEVIKLLQQVKNTFDPLGILNPNKILNAPSPDQDLRYADNDTELDSFFDWGSDSGLTSAVQKCNGAGVCLQLSGTNTMCPSYRVTREEKHGTRGRANVFRQILTASSPVEAMDNDLIKEVLDLCLSCKGCKSECPAQVDMAQMKAEFMQHYNDQNGTPLRSRIIDHFDSLSLYASYLPEMSNILLAQPWMKTILGFHPHRQLPKLASIKFSQWWKNRKPFPIETSQAEVVLVLDIFSEYFEPDIAIAAISVLENLNFRVTVTPCLSLGRAQISQGLLRHARQRIVKAINILLPYAQSGIPLVGLEPSEILTLRDEAQVLFKDGNINKQIETVSKQAYLFDEFIVQNQPMINSNNFRMPQHTKRFLVHGHCHQKSLVGMQPTQILLSQIPDAIVDMIPSGCCGMAGAFGYEKEHYKISMQIAELELFPAVRNAPNDTLIVASGASCRHQILDGLGVRAFHPAEILAQSIGY